ncbi:MAG: hypothetical protein JW802_05280 [Campylobacterales bacterium]|nr:hypothetical protein [Campylobacterales bacterium]MBN2831976.1 hypothetical protein [Campylobacterales bacterium]
MKVNNVFLVVIVFMVSGCYMGAKTYEIFEKQNNGFIARKTSIKPFAGYYIKKDYNETEYIYIRDYERGRKNIPDECVFGFITKKDDPKQIAIRWEIISGKEYCKEQQQYTLIQ